MRSVLGAILLGVSLTGIATLIFPNDLMKFFWLILGLLGASVAVILIAVDAAKLDRAFERSSKDG